MTTTRTAAVLVGLLLVFAAPACSSGSDDEASHGSPASEEASTTSESGSDVSPETAGDSTLPADLPLESVVRGLEVAMEPEDVQVDGDTVHVYIGDDNTKVPPGTECLIVTSVLPDGAGAVIHRGGEDTTC